MPRRRSDLRILYVGTLPPHAGGSAISGAQLILGFAKFGHFVRAIAPMTQEALRSGDEFARRHTEIAVSRYLVPHFEVSPNLPASDEFRRNEGGPSRSETWGNFVLPRRPRGDGYFTVLEICNPSVDILLIASFILLRAV